MRKDAENLLRKLNRQDFRYQEFEDSFGELELWPIFEALIIDERVVGARSVLRGQEVQLRSAAAPQMPQVPLRPKRESGFARYKTAQDASLVAGDSTVNVRKFFNHLSDDS